MKKIKLTIFIGLYSTLNIVAQNDVLKGIIRNTDSISIENVHVFFKSDLKGTYTDEFGQFSLNIKNKNPKDTILISAIESQNKSYSLEELKLRSNIFLEKEIYESKIITVLSEEKVILGASKNYHPDSIIDFTPNSNLPCNVSFVEYYSNNKNKIGKLNEVKFFIGKKGKSKSPFKIRILTVDSTTQHPSKNVLEKEIIVKGIKNQWITIDLKSHNIPFPKEGLFIGLEWIYPSKRKYKYKTKKRFYTYTNGKRSKRKRKINLYGHTLKAVLCSNCHYFYKWSDCNTNDYYIKEWRKFKGYDLFIQAKVIFQQ